MIFNGDCIEIMRHIPDKSIDLVLTDPPFGITQNDWDSIIPLELMWKELKRIIKQSGAIILFGEEPFSSYLRCSNLKDYKYDWIWEKPHPVGFLNAKRQPLRNYENISVFYNKQCFYNPQGIIYSPYQNKRKPTNNYCTFGTDNITEYINYPRQILTYSKDKESFHPTQKPILLLEYLINTYTKINETVLDFTMGSGSTGVACVNKKRKFIGIEKDYNYFEIAKKRIEEAIKIKSSYFEFEF